MSGVPQIVAAVEELMRYLLPEIAKFPRSHRFQLGARVEVMLYEAFEHLITAYYLRDKLTRLRGVNIRLEHLRHYLRLCKDLRLVSLHKYEVASRLINAVGVQLGGWMRQQGRTRATA